VNPDIIYVHGSGFGARGDDADKGGYDTAGGGHERVLGDLHDPHARHGPLHAAAPARMPTSLVSR